MFILQPSAPYCLMWNLLLFVYNVLSIDASSKVFLSFIRRIFGRRAKINFGTLEKRLTNAS